MKILPAQLIGKTVKDCYTYQNRFMTKPILVIEFTDGTCIRVRRDDFFYAGIPNEYNTSILLEIEQ